MKRLFDRLQQMPLPTRLLAISLTTLAVILGSVSLLVIAHQFFSARQNMTEDLEALVGIMAESTESALVFDDPRAAAAALSTLRAAPNINRATIFTAKGMPFAFYATAQAKAEKAIRLPLQAVVQTELDAQHITLGRDILHDGRPIGRLVIESELNRLYDNIVWYALVTLVMAGLALTMAYYIFKHLHRAVTQPLLELRDLTRRVTDERNFSLRADENSGDEMGALAHDFNTMLELIQLRDEKLGEEIAERSQAEAALREADQRKDEFLAMLAHELRNPLAPILNAAYILGRPGLDPIRLRWVRETIGGQVEHLTRLVDELLDVSRISRGRIELKQETIEFAHLVTQVLKSARPLIDRKGHHFELNLPDEVVYLKGDPVRLAQVLVNLLDNAAKYTPEGGHIGLTAQVVGKEIEIAVFDDGLGMPTKLLPHVFDLFQQGERTLDRAQGGLGIGLSLVERLVNLHGGRVQAASPGAGLGSRFTIWLPRTETPVVAVVATAPDAECSHNPLRVLVVDDNEQVAESTAVLLELDGHVVRMACNGLEALQIAGEFRPQVVLLDIGLPGMDGYETARQLRAQAHGDTFYLVAVTGYGDAAARARSRMAGFDAHLAKPVDIAQLNRELASAAETS